MRASLLLPFLAACSPSTPDAPPELSPCAGAPPLTAEVGSCAPDFTLPDRYDRPYTLSSQRGKVALVDISAVW